MDSQQQGAFDFDATMESVFGGFEMPAAAPVPLNALKNQAGNTAAGDFFNFDEGIDTTGAGSFGQQSFDSMFSAADNSTGFGIQQPLLDNTSGSSSWGNVNAFPSTPTQSFDAMYTPQFNNAFGKRPLQLNVQDFPQAKRHETTGNEFALSPFPSSASVTGSSWALDTQPTPSTSNDVGLSDEAADVCATWFSKYNVLPNDGHIDSLSQLTGESAIAIRQWFGQALKQGMNGHDSAYKSQTGFTGQDPILFPVPLGPSEVVTQAMIPDLASTSDALATTTSQSPLRGGKKGCNPTDDPELLKRDPNKIYQCTRKCGKRYGRKCDWKRNEEEGYPSKSWICSLCISQGVERVKPCFRKYHFSQHFRNIHPGLNCADYEDSSVVHSDTAFPRKCGFCPHRFDSRQDRIDHIADHFKQGKSMLDWNDDDDDNNDSDSHDDDDEDGNDRPDSGGGGFGNNKRFFPPGDDQQRDPSSKYDGAGGSGGGGGFSGQQPPPSSYYQFQLSEYNTADIGGASSGANQHIKSANVLQSGDGDTRGASPGANQHITSTNVLQFSDSDTRGASPGTDQCIRPVCDKPNDQCLQTTTEPGSQQYEELQCSIQGRHEAAKVDDSTVLARNAVTGSLNEPVQTGTVKQMVKDYLKAVQSHITEAIAMTNEMDVQPSKDGVSSGCQATEGLEALKRQKSRQKSLSLLSLLLLLPNQAEVPVKQEQDEIGHGPDQRLNKAHGTCTEGLFANLLSRLGGNPEDALAVYKVLCTVQTERHDRSHPELDDMLKGLLSRATHLLHPPPLLPPPLTNSDSGNDACDKMSNSSQDGDRQQQALKLSKLISNLLSGLHSQEPTALKSTTQKQILTATIDTSSILSSISDQLAQNLNIPPGASLQVPSPSLQAPSVSSSLKQKLTSRQDYWKGLTTLLDSQSFLSLKLLGTGGFSTVDEVVHRETNLRVSRKTLKNRDQSAMDELKKEVNVLQKLRHPHIIRFLGAYSKGEKMSILLSPVAETTLSLWLDRNMLDRPIGLAQTIVQMLGCLASSIRYLHGQRPVVKHMDIKPQNILVMQGSQDFPHVVLSDFGVSSFDEAAPTSKTTPLTRQYCAPEALEGASRGQAADIWSLGCVFAEMATVAFNEDNPHWLDFRRQFRGRDGKHYWQDVPAVQDWLRQFSEEAKSFKEATVVQTVKSMLSSEPTDRPDAARLTMVFTPAPCCLSWPNEKASYPGPTEELSTVEMLVHEDGVDCGTQHSHHRCVDKKQPCTAIDQAKTWLEDCSQEHEACRQLSDKKSLPTRLLDLRPNGVDDQSVRIVDGAQLDSSSSGTKYVALSHVRGQDDFTLSTSNLQLAQAKLLRGSLPRSVNEAIDATTGIGYRYLWVDSLCVVQDSAEDKKRECLTMAGVYRNADLTIVLDQVKDIPSEQIKVEPGCSSSDVKPSSRGTGYLQSVEPPPSTALPAIDFLTPGFAWDTRAWSLQERLLSRRLLHIGDEQMYWECNALKASETFPHGLPPLLWEKVHTKSSAALGAPLSSQKVQATSLT